MIDGREWSQWLDRHGPAMLLLARQIVPVRTDAEDVVQEAFVRFWTSRGRASDPAAYLFHRAVAEHAPVNRVRRTVSRAAGSRHRESTGEVIRGG